MVDNPLANPDFLPAVGRVLLIVGVLLAVGLWQRVRPERRGRRSALLTRALTIAWLAPLLMLALFTGGLVLAVLLAGLLLQALREYAALVRLRVPYLIVLAASSLAGFAVVYAGARWQIIALPVVAFLAATLVPVVSGAVEDSHRQVGAVVFGHLFLAVPLLSAAFIREREEWGLPYLVVVGTAVALSDAGAYLFGSRLGGPRLAPRVSPAKTWSGAFGSLVGVAAGILLQWPIVPADWGIGTLVLLAGLTAAGAVWGDLVESTVKRDSGTKDAGDVLAGFGGVLDRFDSFLLTIPLTYAALLVLAS